MASGMCDRTGWSRKRSCAAALSAISAFSVLLFIVSCSDEPNAPNTGVVQIRTTTDGQPPTGDGYTYVLDNSLPQPIGFNDTVEVSGVRVGSHLVRLTNLPEGCSVSSANPIPVGVTYDVAGSAAFEVSCVPGIGNIMVTATTTGPSTEPTYGLLLDSEDQGIIAANGTQVLPDATAGTHAVGVNGIPANCQSGESNPQPVTVVHGDIANLLFTVTCNMPPAQNGTLVITASTTGSDLDGYLVSVDGGPMQPISHNGSMAITNVSTGSHSIQLSDLETGCVVNGDNPVTVTVTDGGVARPDFAVNCSAAIFRSSAVSPLPRSPS